MESVTHVEDVSKSPASNSGITDVPPQEDSDSGTAFLKVDGGEIKNEGSTAVAAAAASNSHSGSSNDRKAETEDEDEEGFLSGEEGSGDDIVEKPMAAGDEEAAGSPDGKPLSGFASERAQVPIKLSADGDADGNNHTEEVVGGEGGEGEGKAAARSSAAVPSVPKVLALRVEGVEYERDVFETAVAASRYEGTKFDELVSETGLLIENGNKDSGGLGDTGEVEDPKGEAVSNQLSSVAQDPETVEASDVKFTDEGDSIADSIHVDMGEAVSTSIAVVGDVDESQELEPVKPDENSVVGDSVSNQPEGSVVEAVKFDDKGDAIVESIHVNVAEVVRSGIAVVDQAGEIKDSEVEEAKSESPSGQVSFMEEESAVENPEAFEANGIKSPDEGESAVEMNRVASDETAESYVAVVGDADERNGSEPGKQAAISVAEESVFDKPEAADVDDVKVNDNSDAIVDSIHVDLTEVARGGAVVIDVACETKGSGVVEAENSIAEKALPDDSGAVEVHGVKFTNEGGSVVENIKVDPVEAIRSGVAIVGESVELKDSVEGESNVTFDKSEKTEEDSSKHSVEAMSAKDDGVIVEDAAFYDAPTEDDSVKASVDNAADREEVKQVVQEDESHSSDLQSGEQIKDLILESRAESKVDEKIQDEVSYAEGSTDGESDNFIFGSSARARQFIQELEQASQSSALHGAGGSQETSQEVDGQIVTDSEEEADSEDDQDGKELFDSAALAALLKAASNANVDPSNVTVTSQDGSRLFSIDRPAGLGASLRSRPPARPTNSSLFNPTSATGPSEENLSEEEKKKLEKIQELRVKFLRLVQRLGHSPEDSIATQVLYRLALLAGRPPFPSFSLEAAKQTAKKLEEEGKEDLAFSLNILVLGKSGVGKSSTINSIFGEEKVKIETFEPGTTSVNEICGVVSGVNIRVFDTPGLRSSALEQGFNQKVLASVRKFTKKNPPDIVLYVDRLDAQTRDLNDLPLLRTISSSLGSSIWRNAIVTLTHGACAPPDGPSGSPLSYEVFVAQRSHIIQQYIGQSVGDLRLMNPSLGNPVSLVENHLACRRNRDGQKVLPNGQAWRPQLLLYCFSVKILSEATSASKSQDPFDHRKLFGFRSRAPPLPYLLSSLLQPKAHPKLSADQAAESVDSDIDLDDLSDSDQEAEEDEYDQLPPFKPLRKAQLAQLSKEQKMAYFEEYDYRAKLLQKKQWKEELRRMREMKRGGKVKGDENGLKGEDDFDPENGAPAPVPVPLPDMALPPTFDGDNPAFRYRFLEPSNRFLARPVLDTHGWDHDCGYDGVNLELSQDIVSRFPGNVTVQVTKDKKEFNLHLDSSVAAKHGDRGSTMAGFDIQNVGKQLAYIVRGETKFKNLKKNKTGAGVSVTFLGENIATGVKVEEQLTVGKRLVLVGSGGTVRSQKDAAYGANLEVRLREPDYPIGQDQSSFVLSLMKWRGDLAVGGNLQSQISIGRNSKVAVRMALNNKMSGQIAVKTSSSDHLSLALTGLLPIALSLYRTMKAGASEGGSLYF